MLFSFRPPNADYLGFPATVEGIVSTSRRAEALGYDAVFVNDHIIVSDDDLFIPDDGADVGAGWQLDIFNFSANNF